MFGAFYPDPVMPSNKIRNTEWIGIEKDGSILLLLLQSRPSSEGQVHLQGEPVNNYFNMSFSSEEAFGDEKDVQNFIQVIRQQVVPFAEQLSQNTGGEYQLLRRLLKLISHCRSISKNMSIMLIIGNLNAA